MQPLLIHAVIAGRDDSSLPEVLAEVGRCCAAGAAIVQVQLDTTPDTAAARREAAAGLLAAVRERQSDAIHSLAASGQTQLSLAERVQSVTLRPELAVLALSAEGSRIEGLHAPDQIRALALAMQHHGVAAELRLSDVAMAEYVPYLRRRGLLRGPLYAQIQLGQPGGMSATAENLCAIVRALPTETIWSAGGAGPKQFFVNSLAVVMGGHACVANEGSSGTARLVEQVANLARAAGRTIAAPEDARRILGLTSRPSGTRRAA